MIAGLLTLLLLAPPAVHATRASILVLDTADNSYGLCVAISASQCVTAYHVVEGYGHEYQLTDYQGQRTSGRLGWFDKGKDLAIVIAATDELRWVSLGKRLPVETEDVWMWVLFADRSIHLFEGKWAGARQTVWGRYQMIDGYAESGTSGGIALNDRGEGIATIAALINAKARSMGAQFHRSLIAVQPIVGGVGK